MSIDVHSYVISEIIGFSNGTKMYAVAVLSIGAAYTLVPVQNS